MECPAGAQAEMHIEIKLTNVLKAMEQHLPYDIA